MAESKDLDTMLIVGLLLNLFTIPGLGSLINKTKNGLTIFIIGIISIPLLFLGIGFLTLPIAWIWGIIDIAMKLKE